VRVQVPLSPREVRKKEKGLMFFFCLSKKEKRLVLNFNVVFFREFFKKTQLIKKKVPREKTRKEIQTEKKNEDVFSKKKENF
jgi:hypothetical protein